MEKEFIILKNIDIAPLMSAHQALAKGLAEAHSDLEKDGVIQRFKFTYELSWKMLKKVLAFKGLEVSNPRDVFREAARQKLIDDPAVWFDFIRKRNLTSHVYNRDCAQDIFESLALFEQEVDKLIGILKGLQ